MACSLSVSLLARLVCRTLCPGRFPRRAPRPLPCFCRSLLSAYVQEKASFHFYHNIVASSLQAASCHGSVGVFACAIIKIDTHNLMRKEDGNVGRQCIAPL